jgi:site-specific DNA recombinase
MKPSAAAVYCRISDDRTGQHAGVSRQEKDCRELADRRRWPVAHLYVDNDLSAYRGKPRPQYRKMLEDIRTGQIDAILVWHLDRLHRSPKELEEFFEICDQAGLKHMACVSGDIDLATDDGKFHARILGAVARKESDDKSRRLKRKHLELAQQGRGKGGGTRPFGFHADRVTIKAEEAELIREAGKRILAGESLRGVCADWKRRGIKTVTGAEWSTTVLKSILVGPRTAGLREHQGDVVRTKDGGPVKAEWPGIITRQQNEKLRALLLDPSRRKFAGTSARRYLLTGFIYCGLCDAKLVARPRDDKRRCYVCASGPNFHGCGKIRTLAEPVEEEARLQVFVRLDAGLTETLKDATDEGDDQALLDSLREDEAALEQLARDHYVDRIIGRSEYLAARQGLEYSIEATKRRLAGNGHSRVVLDLPRGIDALREAWDVRGLDWRRSLIAAVVERIELKPAVKGRNFFDPNRVLILWRA